MKKYMSDFVVQIELAEMSSKQLDRPEIELILVKRYKAAQSVSYRPLLR